jgi:NAD+ kinase
MTMPLDLVLVRHGESEGNVAFGHSRRGDSRHFTPEFLSRHSSRWRLTPRGEEQARAAGDWLRRHVSHAFDRYYTSEYLRSIETAALMGFDDATWFCEFYLRERDWGVFDLMSFQERRERYADDMRRRELDTFFWAPPNGESMATLCLRIVMWAFRVRLERMSQERYRELDQSREAAVKLHNCQVLHYTRRDPESGATSPHLDWVRSVCPWGASLCDPSWQRIHRRSYSSAELLAVARRIERLAPP